MGDELDGNVEKLIAVGMLRMGVGQTAMSVAAVAPAVS
jgi:hypothetical protein